MKKSTTFWIILIIVAIIAGILSTATFVTIQPRERGVIFRKFTTGLDKEHIFEPGFKIIAPWNDMHIYNVREQQEEESMDILDKNGLNIDRSKSDQACAKSWMICTARPAIKKHWFRSILWIVINKFKLVFKGENF